MTGVLSSGICYHGGNANRWLQVDRLVRTGLSRYIYIFMRSVIRMRSIRIQQYYCCTRYIYYDPATASCTAVYHMTLLLYPIGPNQLEAKFVHSTANTVNQAQQSRSPCLCNYGTVCSTDCTYTSYKIRRRYPGRGLTFSVRCCILQTLTLKYTADAVEPPLWLVRWF